MNNQPQRRLPARHIKVISDSAPMPTPETAGDVDDLQAQPQPQPPTSRSPRRDLFPYLISGILSAAVVGLVILAVLTLNNPPGGKAVSTPVPRQTVVANSTARANIPNVPPAQQTIPSQFPTVDIAIPLAVPTGSPPPAGDPPRMNVADFKALYDDPARRPIIIDTRGKESFSEGHISGAIDFPEADLDARAKELPKDKLVVAYCA